MMQGNDKIYLIPGLGADKTLFKYFKIEGFQCKVLEWIEPHINETFASYALRLSDAIENKDNFILIGVSLGGIIAQEIARKFPPNKLIIISSVKCRAELPYYFRLLKYLPLQKLIPGEFYKTLGRKARNILGGTTAQDAEELQKMVRRASPGFIYWAIQKIMCWDCPVPLPGIIHIHGTADIVFPVFFIKKPIIIKGGTHIMVFTKAEEINKILKVHLSF